MIKILLSAASIGIPLGIWQMRKYFNGPTCQFKPDLKDKVIIVTGANTGLGQQTALRLAQLGGTIIIASRDDKTSLETLNLIKQSTSNQNVFYIKLDLSDFDSVNNFTTEFKNKFQKLDILINNAGAWFHEKQINKNGIEMTVATNHFGHFLLTHNLLDYLKKTPQSRVIVLSSKLHFKGEINYEELEKNLQTRPQFHILKQYSDSKIYNVQFAAYLQKLLDENNVQCKVCSVHPGVIGTGLHRNIKKKLFIRVFETLATPVHWLITKDIEHGIQTTLHCALVDYEKLKGGRYYADCQATNSRPDVENVENQKKLWEVTEKILKLNTQKILQN